MRERGDGGETGAKTFQRSKIITNEEQIFHENCRFLCATATFYGFWYAHRTQAKKVPNAGNLFILLRRRARQWGRRQSERRPWSKYLVVNIIYNIILCFVSGFFSHSGRWAHGRARRQCDENRKILSCTKLSLRCDAICGQRKTLDRTSNTTWKQNETIKWN